MKQKLLLFLIFAVSCNLNYAQDWVLTNVDPDTGDEPYEIETGDINGDGYMDIVMATYDYNGGTPNQDYIKCYLNDGSGNFPTEITVSSTIQWVDGLTLADINEDGAMDIIATSVNQNKLVYYLSATSMDGAYSYTEVSVDIAIGGPGQVVAGDINNDGHIDLVAPSYNNNRTQWYSGDGSGNFTAESDVENGSTDFPYYVDIADFDADGDLDVLVGFFAGNIEIYYNQYDGTDPDPSSTVSWIKDTESVDTGNAYLFAVAFADVNNDGNMDAVKLDYYGDVEWFNKAVNGTSTGTIISNSTIISNPSAMIIADIDEDGLNDVIVTDYGNADDAIIWFKGAANASPSTTNQLIIDNNNQMLDVAVADFDGDSDIDIAVVGNQSDTVDWIENRLNVLSINDSDLPTITIYPNPTKDVLHFENINENIEVSVFDIIGKQVLEQTINVGETLNVSQLSNGIYTIRINNNISSKFVKE